MTCQKACTKVCIISCLSWVNVPKTLKSKYLILFQAAWSFYNIINKNHLTKISVLTMVVIMGPEKNK